MRIIRNLIIALCVLFLISFIGLIIFVKTIDVNHFKKEIAGQISSGIGRAVDIKEISFDFSILKGVILNVYGLNIANDAGIEPAHIFEVQRMRLDLDLMSFLKERKIVVSDISVIAPKLVVIRDASQRINLQDLVKKAQPGVPGTEAGHPAAGSKEEHPSSAPPSDLLTALLIKKIAVNEGEVIFIDRAIAPEASFEIPKIDVTVLNFSFKDRFEFSAEAGLLDQSQNTQVKGYAQVDLKKQQAQLSDVKTTVNIDKLREWRVLAGWLPQVGLIDEVGGTLDVTVGQLAAGAEGLSVLNGSGQLKNGKIHIDLINSAIDQCQINFDFTESVINLQPASCKFSEGTINAAANAKEYLKQGPFSGKIDIKDISLGRLVSDAKVPLQVEGALGGHVVINGKNSDPKTIMKIVTGEADFSVAQGRIKDINLLKIFLNGLSMIPNVAEKIDASLPEKYKNILQQPDTIFEKFEGKAAISNGRADLTTAEILTGGFALNVAGYYDFSGEVSVSGGIALVKDLSASLVTAIPELSTLLDENSEIYIPMTPFTGPADHLQILPDGKYLLQKIVVGHGKQELQKLIDKAIGGDDESNGQTQESGKKSVEKEIIGNILDGIFGKQ